MANCKSFVRTYLFGGVICLRYRAFRIGVGTCSGCSCIRRLAEMNVDCGKG